MNENLAYQEEPWEEKLNGEIILMSPLPTVNHNWVAGRIFVAFSVCLKGKSCIPFGDGTDVYLTESDHVIPDVMIICNIVIYVSATSPLNSYIFLTYNQHIKLLHNNDK